MDGVSVIIPMKNAELTIEKCILSIVNQSYSFLEIIVCDDGSADGSIAVVEHLMQKYDNISEESFKQTNAVPYEDRIWKPVVFEGSVDETGSVYPIDSIYAYGEQGYCYLGLQTVENTENIRYSDIRPVVNENGMQKEYVIFK